MELFDDILINLQESFENKIRNNKNINEILEKAADGTVTYLDANDYAISIGESLAAAIKENIDESIFPDGIMTMDIADYLLRPMFSEDYELISEICLTAQGILNNESNIGIEAIAPPFPNDRLEGIEKKVSSDTYDKTKWVLDEPIINATQSIVDDAIKINSDFISKSGITVYVERRVVGGCCEWCEKLAGKYEYDSGDPNGIFRRHQRCRCTVEVVDLNKRNRQNVHTKRIIEDKKTKSEAKKLTKEIDKIEKESIIRTHRSLGAEGRNYPVKLPDSNGHTKFAEGQEIRGTTFAGKGTDTELRDRFRLEATYHIPADSWEKVSGKAKVIVDGKERLAEVHWYKANGYIYEHKIKRFLDGS